MKIKLVMLACLIGINTCQSRPPIGTSDISNVVGYVNTIIYPGFNLISNPLDADYTVTEDYNPIPNANSISNLFKYLPYGTQVYKYTSTGYITATYDDDEHQYLPVSAAMTTVLPGEGVFVRNPLSVNITNTFVGGVWQGMLTNLIPQGLSIRSSQVLKSGTVEELGLVGLPGDQIYQYIPGHGYYTSTFDVDELEWLPPLTPIKVGEAFFIKKRAPTSWNVVFTIP